jgi:DNA-binding Lrp family transcriptional regulator
MTAAILKYLKANGEQLDSEISQALNMSMTQLKNQVAQLSASGDVICCKVTRYIDGKKIEGTSCRLSCDLPAPARGRKPGVKKDPDADKIIPE